MFTGIVAAVGRITHVQPLEPAPQAGVSLWIDAGALDLAPVRLGDSIAVQGACMTVVEKTGNQFRVDVSRESLNRTVGLAEPGPVNLEAALSLGDALGGHLLTGHVDGLARVVAFTPVGESHRLVVRVPSEFGAYLAYKGSVGLQGVSLTVNEVIDGPEGTDISVNLIPHTVAMTTLQYLRAGEQVNFEVDLIARYVHRMLTARQLPGALQQS